MTPSETRSRLQHWLRLLLPHFLTAAIAVAVTLFLLTRLPQPVAESLAFTTPEPLPTRAPTLTPAPTPVAAPTILPNEAAIIRQELLDQQAEDARLWMAIYLSRAVSQVADAELSLRSNDLDRVGQILIAIDDSLALAGAYASDATRDPITQLRRSTAELREDLYLRPEGTDTRLVRLRQSMLALIGERR